MLPSGGLSHSLLPWRFSLSKHLLISRLSRPSQCQTLPVQSSVLKEGRECPTLIIPLLGPSGHHLLPDTHVKMFIIALERKTWILEERFLHSWQGDLEYPQKKEIIYGKSWLSFAWYSWSAASWTELKSYINAIYFRWH